MKKLSFKEPVYTTRPILPTIGEVTTKLKKIWESGWLTNAGQMHSQLELELSKYLHVSNLSLFNNGTSALLVACKALQLKGEVITTPFTFPATPHVLKWQNISPVFCDIDPSTLTINPKKIECLLTKKTTAILGVHVYGMPCHVEEIQCIANKYNLKVLYDGAHSFGTKIDGKPISEFGDATMLSFHATKLYNTAEGGALIVKDPEMKRQADLLKNFGIKNENEVLIPGINAKMNELQAALGLINIKYIKAERASRIMIAKIYRKRLELIKGISCFSLPANVYNSMQYFIIRVNATVARITRDKLYLCLRKYNVYARRYFYPLCSDFPCYNSLPSANPDKLPVAQKVSMEVLALPFYGALKENEVHQICDIIELEIGTH